MFDVRRSTFGVRRSAFGVRRSLSIQNEDESRTRNIEKMFWPTPSPSNPRPGRRFGQTRARNGIQNRVPKGSQTGPFPDPFWSQSDPNPTLFRPRTVPTRTTTLTAHTSRALFRNRANRDFRARRLGFQTMASSAPSPRVMPDPIHLPKNPSRATPPLGPDARAKLDPTRLELPAHSRPPPPICRRKSRRILVKKRADARAPISARLRYPNNAPSLSKKGSQCHCGL